MSAQRPELDLSTFERPAARIAPPRRGLLRILLPLGLLLGFGVLLVSTLSDSLRASREISVLRPSAPEAGELAALGARTVVVQASGWIEPDPFAVHVTALAGGVVRELLVEVSDEVRAGQVLATLVDEDARLARDAAAAQLALREAESQAAHARENSSHESFELALAVTEADELAQAGAEGAAAALELQRAAIVEGEARLALASDELLVQRELLEAGASGARQVELAEGARQESQGRLEALRAQAALSQAQLTSARARERRARRERELRIDERLQVELARSDTAASEARLRAARSELEAAELRLERMQVRAPIDGVVLERLSAPGVVLSPERERHAVCTLFDPSSLRVRVDVPQAEIALIFPGQRAEVLAESRRGEAYAGEVLRIVRQANLSKVTLEVQVRLFEPDGLLRPEMLAQVRFFGRPLAEPDAGASAAGGAHSVLVPERLLEGGRLWVLAPDGLAQRREVELGALHGDRIEVLSGINLSDKLIDRGREDLREGDRVHVGGQR